MSSDVLHIDAMRICVLEFIERSGYMGMWISSGLVDACLSNTKTVHKVIYTNVNPSVVPPAVRFCIVEGAYLVYGSGKSYVLRAEIYLIGPNGDHLHAKIVSSIPMLNAYLESHFPAGTALTTIIATRKTDCTAVVESCVDEKLIQELVSHILSNIHVYKLSKRDYPDLLPVIRTCIDTKIWDSIEHKL